MNKKRVMIVEDEPITAMDEHAILSNLGYEVVSMTFSGEAALEQIKDKQPDVVIMDVMLIGEMNGLLAAQKIRREYGTPVVFVSALSKSLEHNSRMPPEGVRFVEKPYTETTLANAVAEALAEVE
jgi:CheY-like chemotaxis protein